MEHAKPLGELVDDSRFAVEADGSFLPHLPGLVYSLAELVAQLNSFVDREPRVLSFTDSHGLCMSIAIGGPFAAVRVRLDRGSHQPTWTAQTNSPKTTQTVLFEHLEQWAPYAPETLLQPVEAIQLITQIVEYRHLPRTHRWLNHHGEAYPLS